MLNHLQKLFMYEFDFYSPYPIENCKQALLANSERDIFPPHSKIIHVKNALLITIDDETPLLSHFKMTKQFGAYRGAFTVNVMGILQPLNGGTQVKGCSEIHIWNKIIFIMSIAMIFFLLITSRQPVEFFLFGIFAPSMLTFTSINYQMKINLLGQFIEELLG